MSAPAVPPRLAQRRRLRAPPSFVVAAGTLGGLAPAARSENLSFEAARTAMLAKSDKLKAAEANIDRQEFEVQAF